MRTLLCVIYVVFSMPFLVPFGIILLFFRLIGFYKFTSSTLRYISNGWGRIMVAAAGCTVTIKGQENIPAEGGICFVSNHNGYFDVALLLAYCTRHIAFVAKKELLLIPFLNVWIVMLGGLFIDRKNPRKALKSFNAGIRRLKAGGTIIIFPEGHRSLGQGILPFHSGSFKLATQSASIIIPVAISGTYDVYEKKHRVIPGHLSITFCRPINTAEISAANRKQALSEHIYLIIKNEMERKTV